MNPETAPISNNIAANQASVPAFVDNVTSQFIVTPTGNPSIVGVSGFIFSIIGNEDMALDSDITDAFTETNISYQDQIAVRPEQFTLAGYVGELANSLSNQFTNAVTALAPLLVTPGLGANFNDQDEQFYDQLALIQASEINIINSAESFYSLFTQFSTTATQQQQAFQYFYNLWLSRTLCIVETPWGILENMAILNVRARQDELTNMVSDFSVTFKAMRFANTTVTTTVNGVDSSTLTGIAQAILSPVQTNGQIISGQSTPQKTLTTAMSNLVSSSVSSGV